MNLKHIRSIITYPHRLILMFKAGWYKNMRGSYTDSHCMRIIDRKYLFLMSDDEFNSILYPNSQGET